MCLGLVDDKADALFVLKAASEEVLYLALPLRLYRQKGGGRPMPMGWKAEKPKTDDGYFEQMTRAIMQAGLNWTMIEKKWPNFKKAFANFSIPKVAAFKESQVKILMKDTSIVRNEKKIRSTIANAEELRRIAKEFGSFRGYLDSFKGDEEGLIDNLQNRFRHLGESSSRIFLYMAGEKLTPTREEKAWHDSHMKN